MELVDDKLFEYSLDASKFKSLIVQSYKENKGSFKEYISYDEFRLLIKNLIFPRRPKNFRRKLPFPSPGKHGTMHLRGVVFYE